MLCITHISQWSLSITQSWKKALCILMLQGGEGWVEVARRLHMREQSEQLVPNLASIPPTWESLALRKQVEWSHFPCWELTDALQDLGEEHAATEGLWDAVLARKTCPGVRVMPSDSALMGPSLQFSSLANWLLRLTFHMVQSPAESTSPIYWATSKTSAFGKLHWDPNKNK